MVCCSISLFSDQGSEDTVDCYVFINELMIVRRTTVTNVSLNASLNVSPNVLHKYSSVQQRLFHKYIIESDTIN